MGWNFPHPHQAWTLAKGTTRGSRLGLSGRSLGWQRQRRDWNCAQQLPPRQPAARRPLFPAPSFLVPRSALPCAKARSSLASTAMIGAWRLTEHDHKQPGHISCLSINKAKGLDSLAVVLIDVAPFETLREGQDQMDYFMGASRAWQLLVVVHSG